VKGVDHIVTSPIFESFIGGIFEEWTGMLSVNGTIEGFLKLGNMQEGIVVTSDWCFYYIEMSLYASYVARFFQAEWNEFPLA